MTSRPRAPGLLHGRSCGRNSSWPPRPGTLFSYLAIGLPPALPQASLLTTTKLQSFKKFADLLEAKIKGPGRAALSCSRDTSCRSVRLFWASDAGYSSVWCWVRAALGKDFQAVFGKVRLECVGAVKGGPDFTSSVAPDVTVAIAGSVHRPNQDVPASAARGSRDMEVVLSHRGSRAIQATAAASVSKTPSAASARGLTAGKGTAAPAAGEAPAAASSLRGSPV